MAITLVSVPLTAKYLGAERYGLWLLLSTFLSWVATADLGLAQSLKNTLATADGQEDETLAKTAVSNAVCLSITIASGLGLIFWVAFPYIDWSRVFNVRSSLAIDDANSAMVAIAVVFLAQLVLTIPLEIYNAYQEGYWSSLWIGLSNIISIGSLIVAIHYQASLTVLVVAVFGTNLLGNIFAAIHIFYWKRPWLRPNIAYFRWNEASALLKIGSQFWIAQVAAILLLQTDLIIVAQLFSAVEVAKYGIALKLFSLIGVVQMSFVFPLWSAYAEAAARQDYIWTAKTFRRSTLTVLYFTVAASLFLVIFGQQIIHGLIGKSLVPENYLLLAMSLTVILNGITISVRTFLNGLGEAKLQALVAPPSSILNFAASIFFGRWLGPIGVSLGTSMSLTFLLFIYRYFVARKLKDFKLKTIG
ncbi:teichoic acid transporter [Phormidium sp. FACHB-592]|uniref:Polysaccharide biosynthesis protein n=1 Tax=Stenomitos frigidus AS-A4 TaxID=2933935 RepID=A0ABV0KPI4_9CYAN|nr:teichoic acid transporter [Phormidium sp. FACHB-592]MBD2072639.1 teichoic acid transporter [Phormidium sp. FACHB-592]